MTSGDAVARWLRQSSKQPPPPDALHPADAFPLSTIPSPPSLSSADNTTDDGRPQRVSSAVVAKLVHPPTPSMDGQSTTSSTRRRSSSLAGAPGASKTDTNQHQHTRTEARILEESELHSDAESEHSDSSEGTDSTDLELDGMRSNEGLEDDEETGLTGRDRRRRRRRKRRNTHLDQRIVEDISFTKEEEKAANQNLIHAMLINAVLIGLWLARPKSGHAIADNVQVSVFYFHLSVQ